MGKQSKKKRIKKESKGLSSTEQFSNAEIHKSFKQSLFLILIIFGVGILIYSNTLNSPFQLDEGLYIIQNPIIKDFQYFLEPSKANNLGNIYHQFKGRYIGFLTFALNYSIHGFSVTGYHIINISIHLISALMVYFLVSMTFKTPFLMNLKMKEDSTYIAFFTALIFVSHPVQTEAINYIFQRLASLAALFYITTLVLYIKSRLTISRIKRYIYFILSIMSSVIAMKTKENTFTIPFTVMLYEMLFFSGHLKSRLLRLVPFMLTLFIIPLTFISINKPLDEIIESLGPATVDVKGVSRWDYFLTQLRVILTYIRLLFFPINQNMDYDYPLFTSFFNLQVISGFLCILFFIGFAFYLMYRSRTATPDLRIIAFGIFWFFITISVESSLIPLYTIINEYRLYLPSVGFFVAIVTGAFLLLRKIKNKKHSNLIVIGFIIIIAILSYATYKRNSLWNSRISLWEDVVSKSPSNVPAHNNLGGAYVTEGFIDKAIEQYNISLKLRPDNAATENHLGYAYLMQGMTDKAIEHLIASLRLNPNDARAHRNIANAYMMKHLYKNGIEHFITAIRLDPKNAKLHLLLGLAYLKNDDKIRALKELEIALELDPNLNDARKYINYLNSK